VLLGVATFAYRYLSFTGFINDHFVHLAAAQQIVLGALPVRDFIERGLPLTEFVSAAGQLVLGEGLLSEAIIIAAGFAVAAACTMLAVYAISRSLFLAGALTAASVLIYPVSYGYPKLLPYAAAIAAAAAYASRPRAWVAALLGAVAGIGFLFRHDHGLLILGVVPIFMLATHGIALAAVRRTALATVVALIVASPFLIWVQTYDGLAGYFTEGIRFSAREAERSTWTKLPPFSLDRTKPLWRRLAHGPIVHIHWQPTLSDDGIRDAERRHDLTRLDSIGPGTWRYELHSWSRGALESVARDPQVEDTYGIDPSTFELTADNAPGLIDAVLVNAYAPDEGLRLRPNSVAVLFYLSWVLPVVSLVVLALRWRTLPDTVRAPIAMTVVLHLAMNTTLLRDPFDMRVRDLIIPIGTLVGFLLGLAWHARSSLAVRVTGRVGVCVISVAFIVICGAIGDVSRRMEVIHPDYTGDGLLRRVAELNRNYGPPYERTGREIESSHYAPLVHYVTRCTPPEARILSLTFAPEVLFYTRRGFAGGQVALTQGYYTTDRDAALLLERMGREDVPLVLMDSESEHDIESGYPTIMSVVHSRYREVLRTNVGPGKDFILLARTDRRALRTDDGRPCFTPAAR